MMRKILLAVGVIAVSWAALGALENPRPSLAVNSQGRPVLAWIGQEGSVARAHVAAWDGQKWQSLGPALNQGSEMSASYVSLALDSHDVPMVAWTERPAEQWSGFATYSGKIRVARWTGSAWEAVGGALNQSENTIADQPLLRIDSADKAMLMWSEITSDFNVENVFFARWDGKSWDVFDRGTLSTDVSTSSRARDFVFDSKNAPILAWSRQVESHKDFNVFVGAWNGAKWVPSHDTLNQDENSYAGAPSLALGPGDQPLVAFLQAARGFDLFVRTWSGSEWKTLGPRLNDLPGGANAPRIALKPDGMPVVAWVDNHGHEEPMVKAWNGKAWMPYPRLPDRDTRSEISSEDLKVDPQGNPVLAWGELTPSGSVLVFAAHWDGQNWQKQRVWPED